MTISATAFAPFGLRSPQAGIDEKRYAVDQVADAIRHRAGRHFGKICVALV